MLDCSLIGVLSGMSFLTTSVIIGLFIMTYLIGCWGGTAAVLFGAGAIAYFLWSVLNLVNASRG